MTNTRPLGPNTENRTTCRLVGPGKMVQKGRCQRIFHLNLNSFRRIIISESSLINPLVLTPFMLSLVPFFPASSSTLLSQPFQVKIQQIMMNSSMTLSEQEDAMEKLDVFKIHGRDKRGFKLLRITAKFFPARFVNVEAVKKYLEENIYPRLGTKPFSVLYIHTGAERSQNFPGISALRSIYESIPINVRDNLQAIYFLHPGLQARLFLATFGRILFGGGLYGKLRYVNRLEYLWEHVRRNEVEVPEFVYDEDEDLEFRPMMDYGPESDHPRVYDAPSPLSMYSMRCIS